jgi:hypothetical protein
LGINDLGKIDGLEFLDRSHVVHGESSVRTLEVIMLDPQSRLVAKGFHGIVKGHGSPDSFPLESAVIAFNLAVLLGMIWFVKNEPNAIVSAEVHESRTVKTVV